MKPAWMCLPPAVLSAFIGVLATVHTAHAASPAFAVQADQVSLRQTDASQFMDGSPGTPGGAEQPAQPATTTESIRIGPGSDEPTTIVYGSDPDTDRAQAAILSVATCALYVAGAILFFKMIHALGDAFHSETPLDLGASR